jgi:electron transfer flavoprotein alpha subunit
MIDPLYSSDQASGLWIYVEHSDAAIEGVSLELLGHGRKLAEELDQRLTAVIAGGDVEPLAEQAIAFGADDVLLAEHPLLDPYTTETHTKLIAALAVDRRPDIFLLGASANGRDLAGRLAVRLRTGLTADCTDLEIDPESCLLLGEVTGFGQGILATITCPHHRPQMATVRPGVFERPVADPARAGNVERVEANLAEADAPIRVVRQSKGRAVDITQAERIVIGGRGTEGDFALLRRLARLLKADLGASRVAVDQGWIGHDRMVGQTGSVTHPKLAVVCGVSGAMQFTVGIQDSDTVVAINSDPEAPIFEAADYCVANDLFEVVPPLIRALEKEKAAGKR